MAHVVQRRNGSWELRESRATAAGPRSRTLASFRGLTPDVIEHALARAVGNLTPAEIHRAAAEAGAPVARPAPDAAAAALLVELAAGRSPSAPLERLLSHALPPAGEAPSHAEQSAAPWIASTLAERGEALKDLLLLVDRLPIPHRDAAPGFPRIDSTDR